jgi:3-deoxy-7-phosphoheptulonate synthase
MIIVTKPGITEAELDHLRERVEQLGMRTHISRGEHRTIIGCIGDETLLVEVSLLNMPGVESVTPVMKPFKLASLEFAAERSVVRGRRGPGAGYHRRAVLRGGEGDAA